MPESNTDQFAASAPLEKLDDLTFEVDLIDDPAPVARREIPKTAQSPATRSAPATDAVIGWPDFEEMERRAEQARRIPVQTARRSSHAGRWFLLVSAIVVMGGVAAILATPSLRQRAAQRVADLRA